ncbi:MAG: DUF2797 domain-containing protein [Bacillaceae bacterium]|nr:DUF2797 domain-containing protein [Bacillaceae bacterium]
MESVKEDPVKYYLPLGEEKIELNTFVGKQVKLTFLNEIACIHCGRKIKKTFNNGSCYPCFKKLPENDLCIVKPHECHFEKGTCRDESFGESHCMIPHYVYLAVSSGVKVGITRKTNHLTRWVDQGAIRAIPIAEVPTRKMAGELEVHLSQHLPDKTDWRKMLKGDVEGDVDLLKLREEVYNYFPEAFKPFILREEEWVEITYPIMESLEKIKSYNLDKQPEIEDRLIGIKGQYLIFAGGVLNVRKFSGYKMELAVVHDEQQSA